MILRAVFWLSMVALFSPERVAAPPLEATPAARCAWEKVIAPDTPCTELSIALPQAFDAFRHDLFVRLIALRAEIELAGHPPAASLPPE